MNWNLSLLCFNSRVISETTLRGGLTEEVVSFCQVIWKELSVEMDRDHNKFSYNRKWRGILEKTRNSISRVQAESSQGVARCRGFSQMVLFKPISLNKFPQLVSYFKCHLKDTIRFLTLCLWPRTRYLTFWLLTFIELHYRILRKNNAAY